jgi:hypothetical protein
VGGVDHRASTVRPAPRVLVGPSFELGNKMFACRAILSIGFASTLFFLAHAAESQFTTPWDGVWGGMIGRLQTERAPIVVTISQGKVVSYTIRNASYDVQYSTLSPMIVRFGDRDHYSMELRRTGENIARASLHGRLWDGFATLTRQ